MRYPAKIARAGSGFMVTFRDIPEAMTGACTFEEARLMAPDALLTALGYYFEGQIAVPNPSSRRPGEECFPLPPVLSAKVLLLNELVSQAVSPGELRRRMRVPQQEVTRLMDPFHPTQINTIALALAAVGRSLQLSVARA